MFPAAWQEDSNITNICSGSFCQTGRQTPEDALVLMCVRGTPIDILAGPVRLFCANRVRRDHQKHFCLHDNVTLVSKEAMIRIVKAVSKRRRIGVLEGQSWLGKTIYGCPDAGVALACAGIAPIQGALQMLAADDNRKYLLEGRLDLWWDMFIHGIVSANIFDGQWLEKHLKHKACAARPTTEMLTAANYFTAWAHYIDDPASVPGWSLPRAFRQKILFEIGLLGMAGLDRKDHQRRRRPRLPVELLYRIACYVLNVSCDASVLPSRN